MPKDHLQNIRELLEKEGYPNDNQIIPLPTSGSNRNYYRVVFSGNFEPSTLIASYNSDINENIAHLSFTVHFESLGLSVPQIYTRDNSYKYFLMQDLGDITLFDMLSVNRTKALEYYKKAIVDLVKFQTEGILGLDLDVAYPVKKFNKRSVMWDLNYFKYYFVKPHDINFDENILEDNFEKFTDILLSSELDYFNYRDFQSRNIMIHKDKPWYIDFQGGRKGPLQYDLVSLLYQAKANLGDETRDLLYNHYIDILNSVLPGKQSMFEENFTYFIYFRLMQVMGAYGFRGLVQRKAHFLQSIPLVISSLSNLLQKSPLNAKFTEINNIFKQILSLSYSDAPIKKNGLTININSFSYKKKGIPVDISGNGGGHVFDCRSLPNPGRIPELRDYTGLQQPIIDYLENQKEVNDFFINAKAIVDHSISNYIERNFNNLQINFGCTGGRHRSVFSASKIAEHINNKFPDVNVVIRHMEIDD